MLSCDFIELNVSSLTKFTSVFNPAEFILSTHAPQQPQDSVRFTIKASADAKTLVEKAEVANVPIKNSRRIITGPHFELLLNRNAYL